MEKYIERHEGWKTNQVLIKVLRKFDHRKTKAAN